MTHSKEHPMRKAIFALTTTLLAAMPALAQDMTNPDEILTARHGYMLLLAMQLAPLGAMAKGTAPYDAAAATEAAKNLAALSGIDSSMIRAPVSSRQRSSSASTSPLASIKQRLIPWRARSFAASSAANP